MFIRNYYHRILAILFCAITVAACDGGTPITQPVTVVVFGDSLTDGYQLRTEQAVPARLQAHFLAAGHTGVRVMNMGISGDTTQGGLARLNLVLDAKPDVVLLELGANDLMRQRPAEATRKHLAAMIEAMQSEGIRVILCGVHVPNIFVMGNQNMSEYKPMFESLADEYDVAYYPNFLKGVQGKKDLNLADGLHPNAEGAQVIADKIYPLVLDTVRDAVESR